MHKFGIRKFPRSTRAFNVDLGAVPLHHSIHHGQHEAGAALPFGGEERLQAFNEAPTFRADAIAQAAGPPRVCRNIALTAR